MHRIWLGLGIAVALAGAGPLDGIPCGRDNQGQSYVVLRDPTLEEVTQFAKDKATLKQVGEQHTCRGKAWVIGVATPVYEFQQ